MSLPLPKGEGRTHLQFLICSFKCTQNLTPKARGAPRGALRSKQLGFLLLERQGILFTLHKFNISKPKSKVWQPINTHLAGVSVLPPGASTKHITDPWASAGGSGWWLPTTHQCVPLAAWSLIERLHRKGVFCYLQRSLKCVLYKKEDLFYFKCRKLARTTICVSSLQYLMCVQTFIVTRKDLTLYGKTLAIFVAQLYIVLERKII